MRMDNQEAIFGEKYCCRCHGFLIDDFDVQFNPLKLNVSVTGNLVRARRTDE